MSELLDAIAVIVGEQGLLLGDDVSARPNQAWGVGSCPARAIVRPATTAELAETMKVCHAHRQSIVPLGGLTGLVDGTTCTEHDIGLSLERMRAIEHLDAEAGTVTCQAGVVLQTLQDTAREAGWMFAVDFGARGTANIGGMISTNAGGNSVLRYGMTREQVLGLEVVLADGTVVSSMNEMLKNNTGYDLKHLFIGSEGTLGIITRAVLRLRPAPRSVQTAFVGLNSFDNVSSLLRRLGVELDGKLSSFEVMWGDHYRFLIEQTGKHQAVLATTYPFYVLVESEGADQQREEQQFMSALGALMEEGLVADAVITQSTQQADQLWAMRDDIESIVQQLYPLIAFDVSLPIREMESYVSNVVSAVGERYPNAQVLTFGHLGDGNLHLAVGPEEDLHAVETLVYKALAPVGGSISAEHGIGLVKKAFLPCSRSEVEIGLMKTLKKALDPDNLLNPDKVF